LYTISEVFISLVVKIAFVLSACTLISVVACYNCFYVRILMYEELQITG